MKHCGTRSKWWIFLTDWVFFLNEAHHICLDSWKIKDKSNLNAEMEAAHSLRRNHHGEGTAVWWSLIIGIGCSWIFWAGAIWKPSGGRRFWEEAWGYFSFHVEGPEGLRGKWICLVVNKERSVVIERVRNEVQFVLWRQYWSPSDS